MKQETFGVAVVGVGNVHIVRLSGELDIATVDGLTDRLIEIAGSTVVVDLAELSFMDSTGLSALVVAKNRMESDGDVLMLTRPPAECSPGAGNNGSRRLGRRMVF